MKVLKVDPAKFSSCEILLVKLTNVAKGVTMAVIYRPPRGNTSNFIAEVNELIYSGQLGDSFIICGDLNCPGPVNTRGLINDKLKHMIEEQDLEQHVQGSTCRTGNILDHILTPKDKEIVRDVAIHDVGISDHSLITCKITEAVTRMPAVQSTFRCWKRLDIDQSRARVISSASY